ncbi:isochorismatase [Priestia aryabhattai]|uniref:isochorismatase family protein n=1 Tax=Priestia aryabhattai TaxID=412384 RepID=UPI001C0C016A|nr:isochorismatase [Priestia aryabhattai]MBU3574193.1 isochorismatase [Priestia aryabhattai]
MAIPAISPYSMPVKSDLPENKVSWKPNSKRAVLLIHDMQQYFLNNYTLDASPITELLKNIQSLKEKCVALGIPVVYTAQPGNQKAEDRALLTDFWGPGLEDDPAQTKVVDELAPNENDIVLTKWRYSAFKRTNLEEIMHKQGRDQLIICGVYAHIGCLLTASDAFMQDIQSFFIADAVADFSLEHHKMAMKYAADRCAVTIPTVQLLEELKSNQNTLTEEESEVNLHGLTLEGVKEQIAELLDEPISTIDNNENLIDRGLDSIRIMSLVENWRSKGIEVNFMKLAEEPTISNWWNLASSVKPKTLSHID